MNDYCVCETTKARAWEPVDGPRNSVVGMFDEIKMAQQEAHEMLSRISTMLTGKPIVLPDMKGPECFIDDVENALIVAKHNITAAKTIIDALGGIS